MKKLKLLVVLLATISSTLAMSSFAIDASKDDNKNPAVENSSSKQEYQKVIDEYKKYLQTVPKNLRDEVRDFRKEMVRLNNEKRDVYKKLSNQAQDFLKKEREFKKKLPIHMRKQLNDNTTEQIKDTEVKK